MSKENRPLRLPLAGIALLALGSAYPHNPEQDTRSEKTTPKITMPLLPEKSSQPLVKVILPKRSRDIEGPSQKTSHEIFFSLVHTVSDGETISSIGRKYFAQPTMGLRSIVAANPLIDKDLIKPGQRLYINISSAEPITTKSKTSVRELAERFDTPVEVFAKINHLNEKDRIGKGKRVILPKQRAVSAGKEQEVYVAKPGDTYSKLKKGANMEALFALNPIPPDNLMPGHLILRPKSKQGAPQEAAAPKEPPTRAEKNMLNPEARKAIDNVKLSKYGYERFKREINRDYIGYARKHKEFNHNLVDIGQEESQYFTWHFTTIYYNKSGGAERPRGSVDVKGFIRSMHNSRGDNCCGIQWLIDRNGKTYQLAFINAKLNHNPPYDSVSTGVEIEASRQEKVTTKQYESAAYLATYALERQGLLVKEPLENIAKGHGEMRRFWNEIHPKQRYAVREDFRKIESEYLRAKMLPFLKDLGYYN